MSKRIVGLGVSPYMVRLEDWECSLYVDEQNGNMFMDEGPGDDRLNGAVLKAHRRPAFRATRGRLVLDYAQHEFDLGELADGLDAAPWVESVNALLRAHAGPSAAPVAANGHAAVAEAPVAGGRS